MSIYNRLVIIRDYFGLSQAQFAQKINRSAGLISKVEKGRSEISQNTINIICSAFGINENWLVNGVGEMFIKGKEVAKVDKANAGVRLKSIRTNKNLNYKEFAAMIGYTANQVEYAETGKLTPSNEYLRKIATCFSINYNWLLTGVGDIEIKEAIVDEKLIEWLKKNPDIVKELRIRSGLD